jgi:hypothetical protein
VTAGVFAPLAAAQVTRVEALNGWSQTGHAEAAKQQSDLGASAGNWGMQDPNDLIESTACAR